MFFYGMIGFPAASCLSVLGVSLFYRLATQPGKFGSAHFGWLIFAAAILPLIPKSWSERLGPAFDFFFPLSRGALLWEAAFKQVKHD